jgi:predicted GTPase
MEDNFQIKSTTVAFADEAVADVKEAVQEVETVAAPVIEEPETLVSKVVHAVEEAFSIGDSEVKE